MRVSIIAAFLCILLLPLKSQNRMHRWAVGSSISATNMEGLFNQKFLIPRNYTLQGRISFARYINPSFNARLDYSVGTLWYPVVTNYPERTPGSFTSNTFHEASALIEYKLNNGYIFRPKSMVQPYLVAGFGINSFNNKVYGIFPWGGGIKFRCTSYLTINVETQYKISLKNSYDYLQHSLGFQFSFGKTKGITTEDDIVKIKKSKTKSLTDKQLGLKTMNGDSDLDSVPDMKDECPYVAGPTTLNGCPDSDGDLIPDFKDNCPEIAGLIENMGCPVENPVTEKMETVVTDTDGDGILDKDDACPNDKGNSILYGCPDKDGDGIADPYDLCPDVKGVTSLKGCPEQSENINIDKPIENNAAVIQNEIELFFDESSKELSLDSKQKLEIFAKTIKNQSYKELIVSGYSVKTIPIDKGINLSMDRAIVVSAFLENLGLSPSRIKTLGYGQFNNKYSWDDLTEAKKNNRVKLEIIY